MKCSRTDCFNEVNSPLFADIRRVYSFRIGEKIKRQPKIAVTLILKLMISKNIAETMNKKSVLLKTLFQYVIFLMKHGVFHGLILSSIEALY